MTKIKVSKYKHPFSLAEIFQSLDIKMAFVNKDLQEVTAPCKCRDFLGDCIWSYKTKNEINIYGFKYDFKKEPYDLETTRMTLKFPTDVSKEYFLKNFSWLTDLEEKYGLPKSTVQETTEKDTLLVEGDKEWQTAPWKISLYTYFFKVLSYKDKAELKDPEDKYSKLLTKEKLDKFMKAIKIKEDVIAIGISYQHNNTGFVSIMKGNADEALRKLVGF